MHLIAVTEIQEGREVRLPTFLILALQGLPKRAPVSFHISESAHSKVSNVVSQEMSCFCETTV